MKDYYANLGVVPTAEDVVIRAAYKALVQRYHPDRYSGDQAEANAKMAEINEAYGVLSDPIMRKQYDVDRGVAIEKGEGNSNYFGPLKKDTVSPPADINRQPNDFTWGFYSKGVWLTLLGTVIGLFDPPYGYYSFLHFAFFSVAAYGAYLVGKSRHGLTFLLVLMAFLYNPVTSFTLGKDTRPIWIFINLISLVLLFYARHVLRTGTLEAKTEQDIEQEFLKAVEQEQADLWERLRYLELVRSPSKKEEKQRRNEIDQINASLKKLEEVKSNPVSTSLGYVAATIISSPFVLWYFEDKIKAPWKLNIEVIIGAGLAVGAGVAILSFLGAWTYRFFLKSSGGSYRQVRQSLPSGYSVCVVILGLAILYGYYQLMDSRKDNYNQQIAYEAQKKFDSDARVKTENEARLEQQRQAARAAGVPSTPNYFDPRTESLISELENMYREIDPKSPAYRQDAVDQILALADQIEQRNVPRGAALEQATRTIIQQLRSSNITNRTQQNPTTTGRNSGYSTSRAITGTKEASDYQRLLGGGGSDERHIVDSGPTKCVVKPVMTDEDFARCKD